MHILLPLLLLTTTLTLLLHPANGSGCQRRVCYFRNNAQHGPTLEAQFFPEDIDPTLCSHIVYTRTIMEGDRITYGEKNDESNSYAVGNYEKVIALKKKVTGLNVLLGLNAGNCDKDPFLKIAASESSRNKFSADVIKIVRNNKFDGFVFHCLFLAKQDTPPPAKEGLIKVVEDLRRAFNSEATGSQRLLLVLTAYGDKIIDDNSYNISVLIKTVDWVHLLAYNLHGDWSPRTGHHSPLYPNFDSKGSLAQNSVDTAVIFWLSRGAPKGKIVVALPPFGNSYTLTSTKTYINAPSKIGNAGPYTKHVGFLAYYEICHLLNQKGTLRRFIERQEHPYLIAGDQWVAYDDVNSLIRKVRYIKQQALGGFVFFALDFDDFSGRFCQAGRYPLLKAVNAECLK